MGNFEPSCHVRFFVLTVKMSNSFDLMEGGVVVYIKCRVLILEHIELNGIELNSERNNILN